MKPAEQAAAWADAVRSLASERGLRYDEVGGLNPKGGPAALCPGGSNRIVGELAHEFWGASCDADEHETGGWRSKAILPRALLAKAHMPDLAEVMPAFNVESIERRPGELVAQRFGRRVEFESVDFNRRYLATVPKEYDPTALRELFSPGFLDWVASLDRELEFGVGERQIWFHWRLAALDGDDLEAGLEASGELFRRVRREMEEHGLHTYPAGPWHAGLEPFPDAAPAQG